MDRSWLVQRLNRPVGHDNPFSFGGGLKHGGLSDQAMDILRGVFSFDYMGAAEFEFGAVPEALQGLAKDAKQLIAFSFAIPIREVAPDWRDKTPAPDGDVDVFVLCRKRDRDEVQARIRVWASEEYNRDLKEPTFLSSALRPSRDWHRDTAGWLELNNGFLFFADEDMWRACSAIFGVDAPPTSQATEAA